MSHFFEDITHFDGKFFKTIGLLATKPGFLSAEYVRGRRASYLDPVRMYVFTSALFFLVFYSTFPIDNIRPVHDTDTASDSTTLADPPITFSDSAIRSLSQYDSLQSALPREKRDGWLTRRLNRKLASENERFRADGNEWLREFLEKMLHSLPALLFVSLPLFAFYLNLLNYRKKYAYTDHAVFLIHQYVFTFILLLLVIAFFQIRHVSYVGWTSYLIVPILLYGFIYTIIAMKRFYHSTRSGVLFKFVVFNILAVITVTLLFGLFLILTLFRI